MEEKEYPIWVVSARWDNKDYPNNGTSFTVSYRKDYTQEQMDKKAQDWFKKMCAKKYPNETITPISLKVEFKGKSVWFGQWFSHKSLNRFETQEEAFKSFSKYMDSLKKSKPYEQWDSMFIDKNGYEYCVMGAENEWRWKYCECKACKRLKQTIIQH